MHARRLPTAGIVFAAFGFLTIVSFHPGGWPATPWISPAGAAGQIASARPAHKWDPETGENIL